MNAEEHSHDWQPVEGARARYACACGACGQRALETGVIELMRHPHRLSRRDDRLVEDEPAWWKDATYFERQAARKPRATLFGRRAIHEA